MYRNSTENFTMIWPELKPTEAPIFGKLNWNERNVRRATSMVISADLVVRQL